MNTQIFTEGNPIIMYDYTSKKEIDQFESAAKANRILFKGVGKYIHRIYNNMYGMNKKVELLDGRVVYFRLKRDG